MVLFSQPGQETAFSRMEDLVFEEHAAERSTEHSLAGECDRGRRCRGTARGMIVSICRGPPRHVLLRNMSKNLVIVESPAKAKTIKKYLGKDFEVMASYGHVRDLVPKEGAVDPTRQFAMRWEADRQEREARRRDRARREEGRRALPLDRPRPRGRGDLLAPLRAPEGARRARRQGRAPQRLLRNHARTPCRKPSTTRARSPTSW